MTLQPEEAPRSCPFCGSAAKVVERGGCGVRCSQSAGHMLWAYGRTRADAIANWNTRLPYRPDGVGGEEAEPAAWRVKDYADGWIVFVHEQSAKACSEHRNGALIQPLYARLPALVGGGKALNSLHSLSAPFRPDNEPEGWALVPREPTEAMMLAALRALNSNAVREQMVIAPDEQRVKMRARWDAMILAATDQQAWSGGAEAIADCETNQEIEGTGFLPHLRAQRSEP